MAQEYPLTIDTETGLRFIFVYLAKATRNSLIPAGSTATMILSDAASIAPRLTLTTESGHITLDADEGRVTTVIPRAEAVALRFHQAVYKFYLNRPDGTRKKLLFGPARKV